ncbi:MAG TPA: SDR family NAD(P)-dependent oxidoreductase [Candidatus Binatia bacterium]|jgi:light-dependent protochlorophyllide reductase
MVEASNGNAREAGNMSAREARDTSARGTRTVLVTGGNSGIGYECARALAKAGHHVVIASRSRRASDQAVSRIASEAGSDRIEAMELDLASPESIRELVAAIDARDLALEALVCNAGLQFTKGPVLSEKGYELTFAVNHLGHFLLVNLLLSRLLASAPARIVVVSSGVHDSKRFTGMPKANVTDMQTLAATGCASRERFNGGLAYVNSKLCNLWFSYELARRLAVAGIGSGNQVLAINAFDPGLVPGSGLAREYPGWMQFVWSQVMPAMAAGLTRFVPSISTAEKSGAALAQLVLDPRLAAPGARYYPSHTRWYESPSSDQSYDAGRAGELWEASVGMSGLARGESPLLA